MDIVDLYLVHGDFRTAVRLSGLPMNISPNGSWFKEFQVEPEELRGILNDYAELREIGQF